MFLAISQGLFFLSGYYLKLKLLSTCSSLFDLINNFMQGRGVNLGKGFDYFWLCVIFKNRLLWKPAITKYNFILFLKVEHVLISACHEHTCTYMHTHAETARIANAQYIHITYIHIRCFGGKKPFILIMPPTHPPLWILVLFNACPTCSLLCGRGCLNSWLCAFSLARRGVNPPKALCQTVLKDNNVPLLQILSHVSWKKFLAQSLRYVLWPPHKQN